MSRSITINDLIDLLQDAANEHGGDAQVIVTANYGDRCHTPQALFLDGNIEKTNIKTSGYSCSGYQVCEDEDGEGVCKGCFEGKFVLLT